MAESGATTEKYMSFKHRYNNIEDNQIIIAIKQKIIDILHKVMDIQNDIRLTKFLIEFYKSDSDLVTDPIRSGPEQNYLVNVDKEMTTEDDEAMK